MSNSDIEQAGTVKGHIPNGASLSGRISNVVSLSGHISIGGASTAEEVSYTNTQLPNVENVKGALDAIAETQQQHEDDINVLGDLSTELDKKSHTHTNKDVLDRLSDADGNLQFDGKEISGGGASDFLIKMTIEVDGNNYTVTSCDKTIEQIDAAVVSGQNIKAIAFDKFIMPMIQIMEYGELYTFGAFLGSFFVMANVAKNHESGTDDWQFYLLPITADIVDYSNEALPKVSTVEEALNELVPDSHTHANKAVLDKFAETDGKPTYGGQALGGGGGAGDFIIKMTVTSDDNGKYTVTSCDATVEQIDAAVSDEKRVVVIATDTDSNLSWDIPIVQGFNGSNYYFATFLLGQAIVSFVEKVSENQARWQFVVGQIGADFISYSNDELPNHISTVGDALNNLVPKSHTHSNKDTLDKLSDSNGKLQYNGSDVGLKGDKGDTPVKGTDYWTAADKAEIVADTLAALPTWTGGNY